MRDAMPRSAIPEDINLIFAKPGCIWTSKERIRIINWLNETQQLEYLLNFALSKLSPTATAQEAEDTWQDFCTKKLDVRIKRYNPANGRSFWNYLIYKGEKNWDSFENFCFKARQEMKKNPMRPYQPIYCQEDQAIELEIVDESIDGNPEEAVKQKEMYNILQKCLNKMPFNYWRVIIMFYFEGKSVAQISESLQISVAYTKVLLHRTRQHLAKLLREEGYV